MAENSAIEWCDHTFNPWEGCQSVGPGCDHCYAEARDIRFTGGKHWGPGAPRRRTSPSNWAKPRKWQREAAAFREKHGHWPRVFCASLADVFDNAVDPAWRKDLWQLIRETPDLRWILLTKRVGNIAGMLPFGWLEGEFDHVGLMITVVDQPEADRDVPKLLDVPITPRQWFGISHEPALGLIRFDAIRFAARRGTTVAPGELDALRGTVACHPVASVNGLAIIETREFSAKLSWIIFGGESGNDARPVHPDWARADRDQCAAAGTAFLMKQWGEWLPGQYNESRHTARLMPRDGKNIGITLSPPPHDPGYVRDWGDGNISINVGKKGAARFLDGRTHDEFPEALS